MSILPAPTPSYIKPKVQGLSRVSNTKTQIDPNGKISTSCPVQPLLMRHAQLCIRGLSPCSLLPPGPFCPHNLKFSPRQDLQGQPRGLLPQRQTTLTRTSCSAESHKASRVFLIGQRPRNRQALREQTDGILYEVTESLSSESEELISQCLKGLQLQRKPLRPSWDCLTSLTGTNFARGSTSPGMEAELPLACLVPEVWACRDSRGSCLFTHRLDQASGSPSAIFVVLPGSELEVV